MPEQKKNNGSFTSLRILSEKAQKILAKAREIQQGKGPETRSVRASVGTSEYQHMIMHVSVGSIVKATAAALGMGFAVLLIWLLQDKLVIMALSIFVAMVIDPGVTFLQRYGIPRGLAILLHYFVALFLVTFLIISLVPVIARQMIDLAQLINDQVNVFLHAPSISLPFVSESANATLTQFLESTLRSLSINRFTDALQQVGQSMSTAAQSSVLLAAQVAGSVFNFMANLVLILVLAFFLQLEKESIIAWLRGFVPVRLRPYVDDKSIAIQTKIAQWTRGQLVLCLFVGMLAFLAMTILRVPYALTLGILAGFTEFIPVLGPIIAAIPAIIIALSQNGLFFALIVTLVYYAIQWCENNLLVPLIMKRAVGLSPIAVMFAMLIGISFPGVIHPVLGIILSIPVTTIIALFLEDLRDRNRRS
jgi:predicted PurR-regulated permease PerM